MSDVRRRERHDGGFTLIETIVVVVLIAVVATVLAATVSVILRTTGPTGTRADDSRTLHALNTWLAQDASATAPNDFQLPGNLTECGGAVLGTSLVKMTWTEDTGTPVNFVANYRHVAQGSGDYRIDRYTCSGTGAGPYGNTLIRNVGSDLPATPPAVTPVFEGADVVGVEFEVFSVDGASIFVDGDTRNPSETLPSTTTSTTTTTTTTSTTTTTTLAPGPCSLVSLVATPNPAPNQGSGVKRLQADVNVAIEVSGTCGTITLQYDRGDGMGLQTDAVSGSFPNYTVILPRDSSMEWSEGNHPLEVFDGTTLLNTTIYDLVIT